MRRASWASTRSMSMLARVVDGGVDRLRGDLVEDHPVHRDLGLELVEQVPGDRLALAVLVGGEVELVGVLEQALELGDVRLLVAGHDVVGLEVVVDVDAEAAPRLALDLGRDVRGALRQVADVADGGLDDVAAAEVARDRAGLGRRLDDHQLVCHVRCVLLPLRCRDVRECCRSVRGSRPNTVARLAARAVPSGPALAPDGCQEALGDQLADRREVRRRRVGRVARPAAGRARRGSARPSGRRRRRRPAPPRRCRPAGRGAGRAAGAARSSPGPRRRARPTVSWRTSARAPASRRASSVVVEPAQAVDRRAPARPSPARSAARPRRATPRRCGTGGRSAPRPAQVDPAEADRLDALLLEPRQPGVVAARRSRGRRAGRRP